MQNQMETAPLQKVDKTVEYYAKKICYNNRKHNSVNNPLGWSKHMSTVDLYKDLLESKKHHTT
eukprot:15366466-Ditylum_brightwellii.AAC.1